MLFARLAWKVHLVAASKSPCACLACAKTVARFKQDVVDYLIVKIKTNTLHPQAYKVIKKAALLVAVLGRKKENPVRAQRARRF